MRKWYNFETLWRSLKDDLRALLLCEGIKYELSGCGKGWHFEIFASVEEADMINNWLDQNTIKEVR